MSKEFKFKVLFIVSVFALFLFAVVRFFWTFFIDTKTLSASKHLPFLIISAIIVGSLYALFFKKTFPKGWRKQSSLGKILLVVVFVLLSFAVLKQGSVTLDLLLPGKHKEMFQGIIISKNVEITRKGTKFYSLLILVSKEQKNRIFEVSKDIYYAYNTGDSINKTIITGYLGTKYLN